MKRRLIFLAVFTLLPLVALAQQDYTHSTNFVPLTALPGLSSITATSNTFTAFFNNLYKICIGAAAVLAVLQIVRAGVEWMAAGDNTERVSHARTLILNSVFGLILVLSPVIIFSIINPNILSLNLNVTGLQTNFGAGATGAASNAGAPAASTNGAPGNSLTQGGNTPPGGSCSSDTSTCQNGLACNNQGLCEKPASDASVAKDGDCSGNDNACQNGLVCNNAAQCEPAAADGSAAAGGDCSGNEAACATGTICDNSGICESIPADGAAEQGQSCLGNENACDTGLTCDNNTDTCQPDSSVNTGNTTVQCNDGTTQDQDTGCANDCGAVGSTDTCNSGP